MKQKRQKYNINKLKGQGMVETLITIPVLLFIGAALVQLYFIWEAKLTLNQAVLMAARAGAVSNIDIGQMNNALAKGLIPLQAPDLNSPVTPADTAYFNAFTESQNLVLANSLLRIANPTVEAFADFGIAAAIPNDHLQARATQAGALSGVNIQDANLLRIQVAYGIDLNVPFVGAFILGIVNLATDENAWHRAVTLDQGFFPIQAVATVRMQSEPRLTPDNQPFFMTRQDVQDAI